jgi:sn-glycerol 3-phosphate transport system substrate-binding protein
MVEVRDVRAWSRRGFLGTLAGVAAGTAAGCGGDQFIQVPGTLPRDFARRTHVVLWHSFGGILQEALQKLVDEFNQTQRDIYVEAQFQGSYEQTMQKVAAAIIARQIPDLSVFSEITWRKMHLADALEPLNGYFDDGLAPEMYIDQFIEEGTVQGTTWWVPFARSTPLFYYNRQIFEAAGLPARAPKAWEEFREWAPEMMTVQGKAGSPRAFAMGGTYASWYFQNNIWVWGARFSDDLEIRIGEESALAAGRWMVEFIRKDGAAYLSQTPDVDFGNGAAACTLLSTGSLKNTSELAKAGGFDVGTGFLLEHDGAFGCPTGGSGFGILRNAPTERKQAAFEFMKFLAQPAKSAEWTMASGYLPVVKAAQRDPGLVKLTKDDPNFSTALQQLPRTKPQDLVRPLVSNAGYMMDVGLQKLYSSNLSVEAVFGRLQKQLQSRANLIRESYTDHYE